MRTGILIAAVAAFLTALAALAAPPVGLNGGSRAPIGAPMYDKPEITRWLDAYGRAWREQDAELVASLFTEDARYAVNPLENVLNGRSAIKEYWRGGAGASQKDIAFDYEIWAVTDDMVIAHWTAAFTRSATQERVHMDGVFRLVFEPPESGGLLCSTLEEWWFAAAKPPR